MPSTSNLHIEVVKNQSLVDLAVIEGGGVEALFEFAEKNGFDSLHPELQGGELLLPPVVVNARVVAFLQQEGKRVATAAGINELVNPEGPCDDGIGCWAIGETFIIQESTIGPPEEPL